MPTAKKSTTTSPRFSPSEIAAARAAVAMPSPPEPAVDWSKATVTPGGGITATIAALRKARGPNKSPKKTQVAIRLDQDVLGALRASGPGWQTRVNAVLKEWLANQQSS